MMASHKCHLCTCIYYVHMYMNIIIYILCSCAYYLHNVELMYILYVYMCMCMYVYINYVFVQVLVSAEVSGPGCYVPQSDPSIS